MRSGRVKRLRLLTCDVTPVVSMDDPGSPIFQTIDLGQRSGNTPLPPGGGIVPAVAQTKAPCYDVHMRSANAKCSIAFRAAALDPWQEVAETGENPNPRLAQRTMEPKIASKPESVCCRCSQIIPAGKPAESKAQQTAAVPRKDRAVQTDPWRRVSQQDASASDAPRRRRAPPAQATAPAAPRNGAKKARPDAPVLPRVAECRHGSAGRPPEPEPVTAGNSWSTVVRKKQTRRTRPDAVVVEAPGKSYSEILALVTRREDRQLTDLGGAVTKVRRTARGNLLLEVARGSTESAESMRDSISRVLGDTAEVRALTEESKVCVFEIRNLDAITTEKEIRTALAEQYQLSDGAVRIRSLRPGYGDFKTAVFSLPCSMAKEVRRRGKVRIGWTICRVREREGPPRCFRCLELGHIAIRCKSLVDKSGCCIKCGEAGYKAVACKKEPVILPASSGEADVQPGSKSRQAGKVAAQDLLTQTVREVAADVAILSEPYRVSVGGEWTKVRSGKAALWLCGGRRLRMSNILAADGFVRAEVGGYCVYSCYLAPSLPLEVFSRILDDLSSDLRGRPKVIVGGDFNAWAQEWGSVSTNARGRSVLEAFASTDLFLLNDGERHTFVRAGAASIIDLTYVSGAISQTARWGICDAYTGSDHEAIICSVGGPAEDTRAAPRPSKAYRPYTLCTQAFTNALDGMAAEVTGGANEIANRIAATLEHACDQTRRQLTRARGTSRVAERSEVYRTARKALKTAIRDAKRNRFLQLCDEAEDDPWGGAYRMVVKGLRAGSTAPSDPVALEGIVRKNESKGVPKLREAKNGVAELAKARDIFFHSCGRGELDQKCERSFTLFWKRPILYEEFVN
nr:uncharacterized protein LOC121502730 [Drosophila kikkawai]